MELKCEEYAKKGTGFGICDAPLDKNGCCHRAADHLENV